MAPPWDHAAIRCRRLNFLVEIQVLWWVASAKSAWPESHVEGEGVREGDETAISTASPARRAILGADARLDRSR